MNNERKECKEYMEYKECKTIVFNAKVYRLVLLKRLKERNLRSLLSLSEKLLVLLELLTSGACGT